MVANYTATKKKEDNKMILLQVEKIIKRPDRAVLVYSNMIRRFF